MRQRPHHRALVLPLAAAFVCTGGAVAWTDPCEGLSQVGSGEPDHKILTKVLSKYVSEGEAMGIKSTLVDYQALRSDTADLRAYMSQLCLLDPALTPAQALAAAINAYNSLMLAIVVHFNPPNSVLEIADRWALKFGTFNGTRVGLDDIEHRIIRGDSGLAEMFGARGRIHAGVNCASLSCPDLPMEAFEGARLSYQLDAAISRWLTNPTKNPGLSSRVLTLSKIFDWYGADFVKDSGSVQAFVKKHTSWQVSDSDTLAFATYNWNLNAVNGTGLFVSASRSSRSSSAFALAASAALAIVSADAWVR